MRTLVIAIGALLLGVQSTTAQGVLVAPHAVIIDHRSRSAAIMLYNPGTEPAEVSISTFFGFPITDSTGEFELSTPTTADPQSAAGWVEAYPRRMVIGPLQRQTVRLLARARSGLADGEYWSRIMITAKGGKAPVVMADTTASGIEVGLDLEVRTIIPLQYRQGAVRTGVALDSPRVSLVGDSLVLRARMTREGNAAFIGTARGVLSNESDQVVASFGTPIAVYREIDPRFALGVAGLPAGRYHLELSVVTERIDLPPEQLLRAAPVSSRIDVTLP